MVAKETFLSDTVKFIRNDLDSNITDPLVSSRTGRERFVMTSYPHRSVKYPIITVLGVLDSAGALGMRSSIMQYIISVEIRVWARDVKEKDELIEQVVERLRGNQFGASSLNNAKLHGLELTSMIDVDEPGKGNPKSKIITIKFMFITE